MSPRSKFGPSRSLRRSSGSDTSDDDDLVVAEGSPAIVCRLDFFRDDLVFVGRFKDSAQLFLSSPLFLDGGSSSLAVAAAVFITSTVSLTALLMTSFSTTGDGTGELSGEEVCAVDNAPDP